MSATDEQIHIIRNAFAVANRVHKYSRVQHLAATLVEAIKLYRNTLTPECEAYVRKCWLDLKGSEPS